MNEIKIGIRGDSILSTRHETAKKRAFRSFKQEFIEQFSQYGNCFIDYELNPGEKVREVTKKIRSGQAFDILLVGIGMNDLLEGSCDNNIVKSDWPYSFEADLGDLALAMTQKSATHLIIVGGPSDVWAYPERWDSFVLRAQQILALSGARCVPSNEVAHIMRQMKLSHDKLHFAHDDDTRDVFAKAWAYWLHTYVGLQPVQQVSGQTYGETGASSGWSDFNNKKRKEQYDETLERKMGVRTDSLLNTRTLDRKKQFKTFKGGFYEKWWEAFGPVNIDYDVSYAETVRDVIGAVQAAPSLEVLCVGIGLNDLLEKSWQRNDVKQQWPSHLDHDLVELAAAIRSKAETHLVIVGGPASVWGYPARWDSYMERAHHALQSAGVSTVPLAEAARVMSSMKLCMDGLHFAHCDENKDAFGKACTQWLLHYARVRPKDDGVKRQR